MAASSPFPAMNGQAGDGAPAEAILQSVAAQQRISRSDVFVCESGVKLKLRRVPRGIIGDILTKMSPPSVPMWRNPDKERDEPNPADPSYIRALNEFNTSQGEMIINTYMVFGCKVLEIPSDSDVDSIDGTEWAELAKMVAPVLDIPDSGLLRQVAWLKYHVLVGNEYDLLYARIRDFSGGQISEADVADAAVTFRDPETRNTDNVVGNQQSSEPRNNDSVTDGIGTGVRGTGSSDLLPDSVDGMGETSVHGPSDDDGPLPSPLDD
jgi:hypothetical protein